MNELMLRIARNAIKKIIIELLTPENIAVYGDKLFDFIEDAVADSETILDDVTILPTVAALRIGLNIPDRD